MQIVYLHALILCEILYSVTNVHGKQGKYIKEPQGNSTGNFFNLPKTWAQILLPQG